MKPTLTFISCLLACCLWAEGHFEFTPDVRRAYEQATSLRFQEAQLTLAQVKLYDPDNLTVYHVENYLDFLHLYLNPNAADFHRLKKNQEARLAKISAGDPQSPYYLFAQADVRMQWALVKFRFGEWLSGFSDVNKACRLLHRNQEEFPDFLPNKKDLGFIHALAGYVPDNYKWAVQTFTCLDGTLAEGKRELQEVLQHAQTHDFIFGAETAVMYATILLYIDGDSEGAWRALRRANLHPTTNPLHGFVMANVAMRSGRNDRAITLLQHFPKGKAFLEIPQIDWLLGLAKLRRLDQDAAPFFARFLQRQRGKENIKAAYQKLAWDALIRGDANGYRRYLTKVRTRGYAETGGDQDAQREADAEIPANADLVRARLLFDGGYFQRAYDLLAAKLSRDFPAETHQLEYFYRLGRVLHGLKRYEEALEFYKKTVDRGRERPEYFACNAALQMGVIYEKRHQARQAETAYRDCLSIHPKEYKNDLHRRARAGLSRLK